MPEAETTTSAALRISAAAETDIGARAHNEDTVMLRPDLDLFMLADGAGGHNAGNVASTLAVTTVAHFFEQTAAAAEELPEYDDLGLSTAARRLATALQRANRAVIDIAKTSHRYRGMGTTIVALFLEPERSLIHIGHVGDSRCYRLRDGHYELLTHDHTLINDVLALRPDIPDDQLQKLPRNVITRALGMSENVRVSVRSLELAAGDSYVMCSDGLTDVVGDGDMLEALVTAKAPEEQVRLLLDLAAKGPADDNVAVSVVRAELAPGATARPHRAPPRARPKPRVVDPSTTPPVEDDYPEIMVVGHTTEDSTPEIHIVPAIEMDADLLDAVQDIVEPRWGSQRPPAPRPPPTPLSLDDTWDPPDDGEDST